MPDRDVKTIRDLIYYQKDCHAPKGLAMTNPAIVMAGLTRSLNQTSICRNLIGGYNGKEYRTQNTEYRKQKEKIIRRRRVNLDFRF